MKFCWPVVLRKTMDEKVSASKREMDEKVSASKREVAHCFEQRSRDRENYRREVAEIIRPMVEKFISTEVESHPADRTYRVFVNVDSRMFEALRHGPDAFLDGIGRDIAMQMAYKIKARAERP